MHRFDGDVSKFIRGKKNTTSNGSTYRGLTVLYMAYNLNQLIKRYQNSIGGQKTLL